MRITSSMISNTYLSNLTGNMNRLSKYLEQESTGKAISRISDDPVKTTQSLSARNKLSGIARYRENVSTAKSWLTEVEQSVSELNEVATNAYEKAVSASTDTLSDEDLTAIAEELKALRDEVLSIANATYGGSYLFAGYNFTGTSSGALPFAIDSCGDLYYNGINMSNEASNEAAVSAVTAASEALSEATNENTIAQAAASSDYGKVIEAARKVSGFVSSIADEVSAGVIAARDISAAADIDAATSSSLVTLADTAQAASEATSNAANNMDNMVAVAQNLAKTADEAYQTWQEADSAVPYDASAAAQALASYTDAVSAAATATNNLKTASGAALTAATSAKAALDGIAAVTGPAVQPAAVALDIEGADVLSIKVGSGQNADVSVSGTELLGRGSENLYVILDEMCNALESGADANEIGGYITRLQDAQNRVLSMEANVGARTERLNTLSARYEMNVVNYKQMRSDAEDVDLAEAITNYTTAKTVYDAALAAGAEIIQTSLIDFLR